MQRLDTASHSGSHYIAAAVQLLCHARYYFWSQKWHIATSDETPRRVACSEANGQTDQRTAFGPGVVQQTDIHVSRLRNHVVLASGDYQDTLK
jgi:hypothetical protein